VLEETGTPVCGCLTTHTHTDSSFALAPSPTQIPRAQTTALLLDILVDVVGVHALPSLLASVGGLGPAARPATAAGAGAGASDAPTTTTAAAGFPAAADDFTSGEQEECRGLARSLVVSLWLLHVRDAASLWFAAAAMGLTAPLTTAHAGPAGGGASTPPGVDEALSPNHGSPLGPVGAVAGTPVLPGDPAARAVRRVAARAAAELARAASRMVLLSITSHSVRLVRVRVRVRVRAAHTHTCSRISLPPPPPPPIRPIRLKPKRMCCDVFPTPHDLSLTWCPPPPPPDSLL
jgi:hypothetical protein